MDQNSLTVSSRVKTRRRGLKLDRFFIAFARHMPNCFFLIADIADLAFELHSGGHFVPNFVQIDRAGD